MSSKEDNDETMNQNNDDITKQLYDSLDKIIEKSKSFEEQIDSVKKNRKPRVLLYQWLWW